MKNVNNARHILRNIVKSLPIDRNCECATALANGVITDKAHLSPQLLKDLDPIIGKYMK